MPGTCPFGQETTFLIRINQSFLNFPVNRRIHQVEQREQGTESIPESGIGIHISGEHLSVIRAVMYCFSLCINFIKLPREERRAIEGGIESTLVIDIVVFYFYSTQYIIPQFPPFRLNGLKIIVFNLFQILPGLFVTNKRGGNFRNNLLSFFSGKSDKSARMIIFSLIGILYNLSVFHHTLIFKWLIKNNHKIIFEVFRNTFAIACCVTDDGIFPRNNFHG
ncbi:hypothetical protein SDC9_101480 [bioreactor metagenome]|uniref:Uncharacterized protein n=1 Tax=bioreactor metagenome TaxID=1076179 RepID=A0A645AQV6_9ZZZZ